MVSTDFLKNIFHRPLDPATIRRQEAAGPVRSNGNRPLPDRPPPGRPASRGRPRSGTALRRRAPTPGTPAGRPSPARPPSTAPARNAPSPSPDLPESRTAARTPATRNRPGLPRAVGTRQRQGKAFSAAKSGFSSRTVASSSSTASQSSVEASTWRGSAPSAAASPGGVSTGDAPAAPENPSRTGRPAVCTVSDAALARPEPDRRFLPAPQIEQHLRRRQRRVAAQRHLFRRREPAQLEPSPCGTRNAVSDKLFSAAIACSVRRRATRPAGTPPPDSPRTPPTRTRPPARSESSWLHSALAVG
jgi:hypothetical protein